LEEGGGLLRHGGEMWRGSCGVGMSVRSWFEDNTCRVVGDGASTYF